MFDGYHPVKRAAYSSHNTESPLAVEQVSEMHATFVEHFSHAAGECDLQTRSAYIVRDELR